MIADKFASHVGGAGEYGAARNKRPGKFVIDLPEGMHAASLAWVGGKSHDEQEVLLPRGSQFRVKAVDPKRRIVHLEAIPPGGGAHDAAMVLLDDQVEDA